MIFSDFTGGNNKNNNIRKRSVHHPDFSGNNVGWKLNIAVKEGLQVVSELLPSEDIQNVPL